MNKLVSVKNALERWIEREGYLNQARMNHEIAADIGVDEDLLCLYFRSVVGKSFLSWRKEWRISLACRLIVDRPDLPLYIIGEMVGIPDKSNFKRQFREVMGVTPLKYRQCNISNFLYFCGHDSQPWTQP